MITAIISTSPRPSHPSPRILDRTIVGLRAQLPNCPVVITCDGLSPRDIETDYDSSRYYEFEEKIVDRYPNCQVYMYEDHKHQSGMLGLALDCVKTPLILYLEDDWEFLPYPPIYWDKLFKLVQNGTYNYIRLFAQHRIHPDHEHMMYGREMVDDLAFVKTMMWSQNPHICTTDFYRSQVANRCEGQRDYIENVMCRNIAGTWDTWKMAIYNPREGAGMDVCHHIEESE